MEPVLELRPELKMAGLIVELVPSVETVRMCNSGTEATMSVIRLAWVHGTGQDYQRQAVTMDMWIAYWSLVRTPTLGNPDSAECPLPLPLHRLCFPTTISMQSRNPHQQSGQVAAIIVEPYPANCGLILP